MIEVEENGGAQGQVKLASEWPEDNFSLTLSYTNETQIFYAQKPVEFLSDEGTIETADKDSNESITGRAGHLPDQLSEIANDQVIKLIKNQNYLNN